MKKQPIPTARGVSEDGKTVAVRGTVGDSEPTGRLFFAASLIEGGLGPNHCAFTIQGACMEPDYPDGSYLIVDPDQKISDPINH